MNLAVFGRTKILLKSAFALKEAGHRVSVVGTAKPSDSDGSDERDFERCAEKLNAVFFRGNLPSAAQLVRDAAPELAISMNWPTILGDDEINLFQHGILNAHAGDLPRYRGNACPNWAILNGEERIGLCIHKMTSKQLDAGPIALKHYFTLEDAHDIGDVYRWMEKEIPEMFVEVVGAIEKGTVAFEEQSSDSSRSLRCFPRRPSDAAIDWKQDADAILRLIRASGRPFQGAFTTLEQREKVIIWRGKKGVMDGPFCAQPGQVLRADLNCVTIACGSNSIVVTEASLAVDGVNALPLIGASMRNRLI